MTQNPPPLAIQWVLALAWLGGGVTASATMQAAAVGQTLAADPPVVRGVIITLILVLNLNPLLIHFKEDANVVSSSI